MRKFHARTASVGVLFDNGNSFGELNYYEKNEEEFDAQFQQLSLEHLDACQRAEPYAVLEKHRHMFRDRPGICNVPPVELKLKPGAEVPTRPTIYRVPVKLQAEVERQVQELLQEGNIK